MHEPHSEKIILYTSRWCGHAAAVERFLADHSVSVERHDIGLDETARQDLILLNNGFASVPTLIFPDGTQLTEPSLNELRRKLNLGPSPELRERLQRLRDRRVGEEG